MRYPLIKLPRKTEMALFLIAEELRSRKFFSELANIGVVDSFYEHHFTSAIAENLGLDTSEDISFSRIEDILDKHAAKIDEEDNTALMKHVLNAYVDLVVERRNWVRREVIGERQRETPIEKITHEIPPFDDIVIDAFANIELTVDDQEHIEIVPGITDDPIRVFVENKRLFVITTKLEVHPTMATIYIAYTKLSNLVVRHSGNVNNHGTIKADHFGLINNGPGSIRLDIKTLVADIAVTGLGAVVITGSTKEAMILNSSVSTVDAVELEADSATVTIKNDGNVRLTINDSLRAHMDGNGCLYFKGSPTLKSLTGGKGGLIKIKDGADE